MRGLLELVSRGGDGEGRAGSKSWRKDSLDGSVPRVGRKGPGGGGRASEGLLEDAPKVVVDLIWVDLTEEAKRLIESGCGVGELEHELALARDHDSGGSRGGEGVHLDQESVLEVGAAEVPARGGATHQVDTQIEEKALKELDIGLLEKGGDAQDSEGGALGGVQGRVVRVEVKGRGDVDGERKEESPTFNGAEDAGGGTGARGSTGADEPKLMDYLPLRDALREAGVDHGGLATRSDKPLDMEKLVEKFQPGSAREVADQWFGVEEGDGADGVGRRVFVEEGVDDELGTRNPVKAHMEEASGESWKPEKFGDGKAGGGDGHDDRLHVISFLEGKGEDNPGVQATGRAVIREKSPSKVVEGRGRKGQGGGVEPGRRAGTTEFYKG
jgi:hypothetical protein